MLCKFSKSAAHHFHRCLLLREGGGNTRDVETAVTVSSVRDRVRAYEEKIKAETPISAPRHRPNPLDVSEKSDEFVTHEGEFDDCDYDEDIFESSTASPSSRHSIPPPNAKIHPTVATTYGEKPIPKCHYGKTTSSPNIFPFLPVLVRAALLRRHFKNVGSRIDGERLLLGTKAW